MIQCCSLVTKVTFLTVFIIILWGCKKNKALEKFQSLSPEESGIDFRNDLNDTSRQNIIEYLYYYNGGGVGIGDINNDDLLDIYFTANQGINRLYLNVGDLKFEDVTEEFGLPSELDTTKWSTGVTLVDVNGDGFIDIYECVVGDYKSFSGHNKLYINQGGKAFVELSNEYGVDFSGFSTQSAFLDYDGDGDLDMYLLNHSVHGTNTYGNVNLRNNRDQKSGDRFYENQIAEGNGLIDVTQLVGIYSGNIGYGLGIAVSDLNGDGLSDIYIGNDFHEDDYIYLNNGNKTFSEVGKNLIGHTSQFTMGVDVADINRDGLMDIFSLDMLPSDPKILLKSGGDDNNFIKDIKSKNGYGPQYARNALQLNQGNHFKELAMFYDVYATDWSWSVLIQDFDNDLDQDIYITNGIYKRPNDLDYINYLSSEIQRNSSASELIDRMPSDRIDNVFFENEGNLKFTNSTLESGLSCIGFSNGASYGDLDNDGDLDLVINNLNEYALIFENKSDRLHMNFINISLNDPSSLNQFGVGASVTLFNDSATIKKEVNLTRGFQSSISHRLHFGLGLLEGIDSIEVVWSDGQSQLIRDTIHNKFITITKEDNLRPKSTFLYKNIFELDSVDFIHKEDDYLDYQNEKLLPWALSKEGPGVAVADLNNDGIHDFYLGGAHFQAGELFISNSDSTYSNVPQFHLMRDAGYEDVAAEFIDINFDGFPDLFVASGGGRFPEGHSLLEDRMYLNNGKNQFKRWLTPLPKVNSSAISHARFDGKDCLFVGGRSVVGKYGLTPQSYLLQWEKSHFDPIQFYKVGLITDTEWVLLDGKEGLIVVGDWMPISFLQLEKDTLKLTPMPLFENTSGLWNSITKGDLNDDGKDDYFFSNAGLNSKWKPNEQQPLVMYVGDFDDNGQTEPIIFNDFYGDMIPFNPRMDLVKQVPAINKENNSNLKFSEVRELTDLISSHPLEIFYAFMAESKLLVSKNESYQWKALPVEFQFGAIQDAVFWDNKILYVGNDYTLYSILGKSDANAGGLGIINDEVEWTPLNVPFNLDYRKIESLTGTKFLIVPNAESPFIIDIDNFKD